jgi:hypothetical protein
MPIIFVVALRMPTALGYESDECVSASRIRKHCVRFSLQKNFFMKILIDCDIEIN